MIATTQSLRVARIIQANAETLFRAWTDPAELKNWWRMAGEGWAFGEASIDLRVGGAYRLGMTDPAGKPHVALGVYREINRPVRLVFTWDWEDPTKRVGETVVSVDFKALDGNRTEVVLTHERLVDPDRVKRHEQGWTEVLTMLERRYGG